MADMRPDEARQFYEEVEDPARVSALFDAAERQGKLQRTAPPGAPDLIPLRELLARLSSDLRREWREFQPRARLALLWERAVRTLRSRNRVQ